MRRLFDFKIKGCNTRNTARYCGAMLALALFVALFVKAAPLFSPLIIAFVISLILEPPVKQLMKRIKIRRAFAGPTVIIVLLAAVFIGMWMAIARLVREFVAYFTRLPEYLEALTANLDRFVSNNRGILDWIPLNLGLDIDSIGASLSEWASTYVQGFAEQAVKNVFATAASVPVGILIGATVMLSTFFIIMDHEKHAAFINRNVPQKWLDAVAKLKDGMFAALFGYIRAQVIIMLVVFVILLVGLSVTRVPYSLAIAFLTAFLDALPVFGISMVLVPWSAYSLLAGNVVLCVALIVMFAICTTARRLIEPKLLSNSVGANPLMTVTAMFLGFRLFGFTGLIVGPIIYIFIRAVTLAMMGGNSFKEYFLVEDEL